jgi:hypothetical protein
MDPLHKRPLRVAHPIRLTKHKATVMAYFLDAYFVIRLASPPIAALGGVALRK